MKAKLQKKKEETAAEIRLQEVRARIEALTEYIEGSYKLEEELESLKCQEVSLDIFKACEVAGSGAFLTSFDSFDPFRTRELQALVIG